MPCPRCHGLLVVQSEYYDSPASVFCYQCGYRLYLPAAPPLEPNPKRQWNPEQCTICLELSAIRGKPYCRRCLNEDQRVVQTLEARR